ncbi:hypothetical protein FS749_000966 [Ceratobasidium sp. UAMH 11750]|nr:hypothetical protein FS749_000966 [Ceratobasidium sp. UAMH 11750]
MSNGLESPMHGGEDQHRSGPSSHPLPPPGGFPGVPLGPIMQLDTLQQALLPLTEHFGAVESRLSAIEQAMQHDPGRDGDDEGEGRERPCASRGRRRAPASRKRGSNKPEKPDKSSLNNMKNSFRKILYSGCGDVKKMSHLKPGLSAEELEVRMEEDPGLPWRLDFLLKPTDPRNEYWVNKMFEQYLACPDALEMVKDGKIQGKYWTRECILEHVIKPMWYSARGGVKQAVDPEVKERVERQAKKSNRDARKKRLLDRRFGRACGENNNPFRYEVNGVLRPIPEELLCEEMMSNVVSDEHEVDGIRPDLTLEQYRDQRNPFEYEGIPPFFRHEMWNKIIGALDDHKTPKGRRGQQVRPRYYASKENRGQRKTNDTSKAYDIPASGLYQCHINKTWYDRLPEYKRKAVKHSPAGCEVDEELILQAPAQS